MLKCLLVVFLLSSLFICLSRAQEDEDLLGGLQTEENPDEPVDLSDYEDDISPTKKYKEWNYKDAWKEEDFPECCKSNQSPIDLDTNMADTDATMSDVQFNWQRSKVPMEIFTHNMDITIGMMSSEFTETTILSGVSYTMELLNFHWGSVSSQGSEHTVDGTQYSGEIEFVHYKTGTEQGVDESLVVSVLLQEDADLAEDLDEIKSFQSTFPKINVIECSVRGMNLTDDAFSMHRIIPDNKEFFRYVGSSSTPPCTPNVDRIVFKHPRKVTSAFMAALRRFKSPDDTPMQDTFRKVQPLNDRKVYKSA